MFQSTDCTLIMGTRGCGKSWLSKKIQSIWKRRVIFDTVNEYDDDDGKIVTNFKDFCDEIFKQKENSDGFVIIYQTDPESQMQNEEFNQALRVCYYFCNLLIVIDEIHNFCNPHFLPQWLKNCILLGRHQNIAVLGTTQRPGELNKTILSQSNHIFIGRIVETNDARYLKSFVNIESEKLASLQDRVFYYFSKNGIKMINTNNWS